MAIARLLYDQKVQFLNGRFEARIVAYEVAKSKKFPAGVKLRCVLLDLDENAPILLLDIHEPYGYHLHTKMQHDKSHRVPLNVKDYIEAIGFFINEIDRVIKNEKQKRNDRGL